MSLFPAYTAVNTASGEPEKEEKNWLSNSSFGYEIPTPVKSKDVNESSETVHETRDTQHESKSKEKVHKRVKRSREEKKKKKKKKRKSESFSFKSTPLISDDPSLYTIDRERQLSFLSYKTLTKPLTPRYHVNCKRILGFDMYDQIKLSKVVRYYVHLKNEMKEVKITDEEESSVGKKAEEFNKRLCKDSDIAEWIEFMEFQDEYYIYQNITYNSETEKKRAILQKKFDILEKAMGYNPKNEELQKYWMNIANEILSADEFLMRIEKMVKQSPEALSLWLNLISARQQSLALCTFPSVSEIYKRAVNGLQCTKALKIIEKDLNILELLHHYCKFLDQCGQWEILWTILKSNLNLNFGKDFKYDSLGEDQVVKDLENEIVSNDKQPIWVTWRRIETLREGVHFLPVAESLDYPQRCVSTEDFMDFILHFHRDMHFKLIVNFIMILKVPLLPSSDSIFRLIFKHPSPWTLDSPELILSSIFHSPAVDIKVLHLKPILEVTRGPQYIRNIQGQSQFLELVQKSFEECINLLEETQRTAIALWWLRFNRWLYILDKNNLAGLQVPAKKMKSFFKDFMKNRENRDNLFFYCEYGLFEYNQGNIEASVKTLKTLISSRPSVYHLSDEKEKAALCYVYKCLSEIYIKTGRRDDAIRVLVNLGAGSSIDSDLTDDSLASALHKYEHISIELLHEIKDSYPYLEHLLLPQFSLEWISCYMWLQSLIKSTTCMMNHMKELCPALHVPDEIFPDYAREMLLEMTCIIHWSLDRNNVESLSETLNYSVTQFPNNLKILSLLASKKLEDHGLWWNLKQSFLTSSTLLSSVTLICVALERQKNDNEGLRNRVKSLFQKIILGDGKFSSVIHSLRLKFLNDYDSISVDVAQVHAIESCPWNKGIYMTAVSVLPNKLMQLTDVMIEKELRIHVTPDEIQEMRD